jgi:Fe(3+) dicitrate transport protein
MGETFPGSPLQQHAWWDLLAPLLDPSTRTFWPGLLVTVLIGGWLVRRSPNHLNSSNRKESLFRAIFAPQLWGHRSSRLDLQLLLARQLLKSLHLWPVLAGSKWLADRMVFWLDDVAPPPDLTWSPFAVALSYSLLFFVVWDLSRYVVHRLMHEVPALWDLHQVHHSAEVLTPLTFHRVHPLESMLYQIRGVVVTGLVAGAFFWCFRYDGVGWTIFGVHAVGLVCNIVTGNLRHSHLWLRFPQRLERWFISPAQHQLHHSIDPAHFGCNYGTWLAVWDRLSGNLLIAGEHPPEMFGLEEGTRNHGDHLLAAWFQPLGSSLRRLMPFAAGIAITLLPFQAQGQEAGPSEDEDEAPPETAYEVIVVNEKGIPKVVGSAHVIEEAELERHEYNDIHRILAAVPGVYVREEDAFGLRPNIGIRGANSDRSAKITLMEDGVLLAPAPYAAPAAYYFPMSTRMVGVEVFKGPASIQYGPQTVGGALNLVTRPVPTSPGGTLDVATGFRNTLKTHGWGALGNPRMGVLLEGVHLGSGGFKTLDTGGPTGFNRSEAMLKARVSGTSGKSLTQSLELKLGAARELSHETYIGLSTSDIEETPYRRYGASSQGLMAWRRTQAEIAWPVTVGNVAVRTVAYHHWMSRAWTKLNRFSDGPDLHDLLQLEPGGQAALFLAILRGEENSATSDQNLLIGTNDRRFHAMGAQTRGRWKASSARLNNQLEAGLRYHVDQVVRLHTEDPFRMKNGHLKPTGGDTLTQLDRQTHARALAAHVHNNLQFDVLQIHTGARMESIRTLYADGNEPLSTPIDRTQLLPGIGALVSVTPWWDVFVGSHQGFSPVAPAQPEDVQPELSWNHEVGVRVGKEDRRFEIAGFFNDYQNLTGQCSLSGGCTGDQLDQQYNGGEVEVYGVESFAKHTWSLPHDISIPVTASWTWTRSAFQTAFLSEFSQFGSVQVGDRLPYVPEHQGALQVGMQHRKFEASLSSHGRAEMFDVAAAEDLEGPEVLPALWLLDAAASFHFSDQLTAYLTGTNLTGEHKVVSWRPAGARPTAPMQIMWGLKGSMGR